MTGGNYDISIWWRSTMISMSLSVSVRREDRSRPRIRHRPRQQRVKATADHGRWWRTLPAQSSDRGFGALQAGASRFRSKAVFARWTGTAPIPVWSGSTNFRLNRGGNRQVNAALHRIAITQGRGIGAGRAYMDTRIAGGDSKKEALRMLRRRLSDEVFRRLLLDEVVPVIAAMELAA
jgi:transposase